ncbi:MAG: N-acetyltransferase [Pseudomonadota bacterium]
MLSIDLETPADAPAIKELHAAVFGPGRFAKAAYRLREGERFLPDLAFIARDKGRLVGSVRFAPVLLGEAPGLILGPLAVLTEAQRAGVGQALMVHGLGLAEAQGHRRVILVGDPPIYRRAGFEPVPPGRLTMPAPVDPARLLWRGASAEDLTGVAGPVRPMR